MALISSVSFAVAVVLGTACKALRQYEATREFVPLFTVFGLCIIGFSVLTGTASWFLLPYNDSRLFSGLGPISKLTSRVIRFGFAVFGILIVLMVFVWDLPDLTLAHFTAMVPIGLSFLYLSFFYIPTSHRATTTLLNRTHIYGPVVVGVLLPVLVYMDFIRPKVGDVSIHTIV